VGRAAKVSLQEATEGSGAAREGGRWGCMVVGAAAGRRAPCVQEGGGVSRTAPEVTAMGLLLGPAVER